MDNFILFILLLIILLNQIGTSKITNYYNLTDSNFDSLVNTNNNKVKWLLLFYVQNCKFCHQTIKIIEKDIIPHYSKNSDIKFGLIDCDKNLWLAIRFNLSYTPYVVLIENNKLYQFKTFPGKDSFINFIDEEKTIEDSLTIPTSLSNIQKGIKIFKGFSSEISKSIQDFLEKKGYTINWKNQYSMILVVVCTILFIVLEFVLLVCLTKCCFSNKSNESNDKKKKNKRKKDKENEEKKIENEDVKDEKNKHEKKD